MYDQSIRSLSKRSKERFKISGLRFKVSRSKTESSSSSIRSFEQNSVTSSAIAKEFTTVAESTPSPVGFFYGADRESSPFFQGRCKNNP